MDDKELLELAAKAAGVKVFSYIDNPMFGTGINTGEIDEPLWNPLTDDGDALRLAVKLRILHWVRDGHAYAEWHVSTNARQQIDAWCGRFKGDECAATRNVIVRAAAEIGKAL